MIKFSYNSPEYFLLDVNFDIFTIGSRFLFISPMFVKFSEEQRLIAM